MKFQTLNHLCVFFICAVFTLPVMAQCPEGKSEVVLMTPSGITKTLCVSDKAIPGLENAADHSGGLVIETIADFPQFDPIVEAYPEEDLVLGKISEPRWPFVLAPNVEPIDDVFLSACTQVNNLAIDAVSWIDENYVTFAGPVPAVCIDITAWDPTTPFFVTHPDDNPIPDFYGLGRDCGVGLHCGPTCQEDGVVIPCCRMTTRCNPAHYTYGDPWSAAHIDYVYRQEELPE